MQSYTKESLPANHEFISQLGQCLSGLNDYHLESMSDWVAKKNNIVRVDSRYQDQGFLALGFFSPTASDPFMTIRILYKPKSDPNGKEPDSAWVGIEAVSQDNTHKRAMRADYSLERESAQAGDLNVVLNNVQIMPMPGEQYVSIVYGDKVQEERTCTDGNYTHVNQLPSVYDAHYFRIDWQGGQVNDIHNPYSSESIQAHSMNGDLMFRSSGNDKHFNMAFGPISLPERIKINGAAFRDLQAKLTV